MLSWIIMQEVQTAEKKRPLFKETVAEGILSFIVGHKFLEQG